MYAKYVEQDRRWSFSITKSAGAVEISDDEHKKLITGAAGKILSIGGDGRPALVDASPPSNEQVEVARLLAYADPIKGSDRYFAEAQREAIAGSDEAYQAAKALGMARYAQIKEEHPWPKG